MTLNSPQASLTRFPVTHTLWQSRRSALFLQCSHEWKPKQFRLGIPGGFTQAQAAIYRNSSRRGSMDGNPSPPPPGPAHFKDTKPINREHSESCCQWLAENRYRESHNDDKSGLGSSLTNVGTKTRHEYPALKRVTLLRGQSISSSQWTTLK